MHLLPLCLILLEGLIYTNAQFMVPRDGRFMFRNNPFRRWVPPPPGMFRRFPPFPPRSGTLRNAVNQPPRFWNNNRNDRAIPGRQTSDRIDFNNNNRNTGLSNNRQPNDLVRPPFGAVQRTPNSNPQNDRAPNNFLQQNQNRFLRPANRNNLETLQNDFSNFQQMRNIPQFPTDLFARRNSQSRASGISPFSQTLPFGQTRPSTTLSGSTDNTAASSRQQQQQQQFLELQRQRMQLQQSLLRRQQALQLALQQQQQQQQQQDQTVQGSQINQQTAAQPVAQPVNPSQVPPMINPWEIPPNSLPVSSTNIIRSLPAAPGSTNTNTNTDPIPPAIETIQPGSAGSSASEHVIDGHLTNQQALERFGSPVAAGETSTLANGEAIPRNAEISHTLITIKDENGNVIAERLFEEGTQDAIIEEYITQVSSNFTNKVNQAANAGGAVPSTGTGSSGSIAAPSQPVVPAVPSIDSFSSTGTRQEQTSSVTGAPSETSSTSGTELQNLFESFLQNPQGFRGV